jgi:hypothetical protein
VEEHERGDDGIVVIAIPPRAAAEGAGVGAGDAAGINEEIDGGLPVLFLEDVGADQKRIADAGLEFAAAGFDDEMLGGFGGAEAAEIADLVADLAAVEDFLESARRTMKGVPSGESGAVNRILRCRRANRRRVRPRR